MAVGLVEYWDEWTCITAGSVAKRSRLGWHFVTRPTPLVPIGRDLTAIPKSKESPTNWPRVELLMARAQ
jgi:hypothetical protein